MQKGPFPETPSMTYLTKSDHEARVKTKPCRFWCLGELEKVKNEKLKLLERIRALEGELRLRDTLYGKDLIDSSFDAQEEKLKSEFPFYSRFTIQEREIFRILLRHKGKLVRKETIYQTLFSHKPDSDWPDDKTLDVVICKMRKKIGPFSSWEIHTVWGEGRVLRAREKL